jgi:hypothetical protein
MTTIQTNIPQREMNNMKNKMVFQSLDHGWDLENYDPMTLTEDDSLEAWHKRQGQYENEQQAFFAMARARLRSAFDAGLVAKRVSMQQYDILHLLFKE